MRRFFGSNFWAANYWKAKFWRSETTPDTPIYPLVVSAVQAWNKGVAFLQIGEYTVAVAQFGLFGAMAVHVSGNSNPVVQAGEPDAAATQAGGQTTLLVQAGDSGALAVQAGG